MVVYGGEVKQPSIQDVCCWKQHSQCEYQEDVHFAIKFNRFDKSMVPEAGIEPARLAAGDFESPASTNFTTRADCEVVDYDIFLSGFGGAK